MPNRILRDWTQSEKMASLSDKAERFFTRLIMKADDFGCYYGNVQLLKSALYPLNEITIDDFKTCMSECEKVDLIICYVIDYKQYVKINDFRQRLRKMNSRFPLPNDRASRTIDGERRSNDSNSRPETKRSRNEVETKRNETETEGLSFFDEDYKLPYIMENEIRIYGEPYQIEKGGMSDHAIKIHCQTYNLKYPKHG
jgi:hypothetical protein